MTLKPSKTLTIFVIVLAIGAISCGGYDLDRNRKLWNESGVTDYRMKVDIQKPGHGTPMGEYIIEVRGRTATTIRSGSNPEAVIDTTRFLREFPRYDTIDEIFEYIEKHRSTFNPSQQIEYDAVLGFPSKLRMEPLSRGVDDGFSFEVLEFEKL